MKYNREMLTLEAIAIIMVVAGHVGNTFLDFGGAAPYYNFHIPLFVFISGYFFRQPVGGGRTYSGLRIKSKSSLCRII